MTKTKRIAVIGGGSWGATLAAHLSRLGHEVRIWEFYRELSEKMSRDRKLSTIPQLSIPQNIFITNSLKEALDNIDIMVSAVPSQFVRSTFSAIGKLGAWPDGRMIVSVTKGIDNNTLQRMSEVISGEIPQAGGRIVILSGPSHAEEVAVEMPTAVVCAHDDHLLTDEVKSVFSSKYFRIYTSPDPAGVEMGGALKNIYALACGICDGLNLGDNTKSALVSRGILEMAKLGVAVGAKPMTFFGLSGLGDLVVTCFSKHSRNRLFGDKIGRGKSVKEAMSEMTMVVEGMPTVLSAFRLAQEHKVELPILKEIYYVLYESKRPQEALDELLGYSAGYEMEGLDGV